MAPPPLPGLASAASLVAYEGPGAALVRSLKYGGDRAALRWWGRQLAALVPQGVTWVTWVPTSPARSRRRGFDQAALLARAVGAEAGLAVVPGLRRLPGPPQTGRSAAERRLGPRFASAPTSPALPEGPVLVVDDVRTTGASLCAAAGALRRSGAPAAHALTAAWRAPSRGVGDGGGARGEGP